MKDFLQATAFKKILFSIGILVLALLIFQAGIFVGYRKAGFSYRWGENYERNFGAGRMGKSPMTGMFRGDFPNAHGATGRILKIILPTFIMEDQDHTEKIVSIGDNTTIRRFRDTIKPSDLKVNDVVVIVGSPDDSGQIKAGFIRLMPADFPGNMADKTGTSTKPK